ncbi:hypothetical protein [Nocardia sp. NPDC049707]|uniref:DUF6197 family protein n=1 Tax=Nocardia sp. NPDC049707 TaxID=3154735 RepID=UPI00343549AE
MTATESALVYRGWPRLCYDMMYKVSGVDGLPEKYETLRAHLEHALTGTRNTTPARVSEDLAAALIADTSILDLFVELHELNAKVTAEEAATAAAYRRADRSRPTVAELLNRAGEIMEQSNGVCRGHFFDSQAGTYTAWGAIYKAVTDGPWVVRHNGRVMWPGWADRWMQRADEFTLQALGIDITGRDVDFYDGLFVDVPETMVWNDAPERTKEEVAAMLRQAAVLAGEREAG